MTKTFLFVLTQIVFTQAAFAQSQEEVANCFGRLNAHLSAGGKLSDTNQNFINKHIDFYDGKIKLIAQQVQACRGKDFSPEKHKECAEKINPADFMIYRNFNKGANEYNLVKNKNDRQMLDRILFVCSSFS